MLYAAGGVGNDVVCEARVPPNVVTACPFDEVPHSVEAPTDGVRVSIVGYANLEVVRSAAMATQGAMAVTGGAAPNKRVRDAFERAAVAELAKRARVSARP